MDYERILEGRAGLLHALNPLKLLLVILAVHILILEKCKRPQLPLVLLCSRDVHCD